MTPREHRCTAPDGRVLAIAEWGDPAGAPVIDLHGTPGSRFGHPLDLDALAEAGVRLITFDRPGYGESTRLRGRQVLDAAADVAVVADALGIRRFAVTGGAGGGPHALAAAWGLPRRIVVAECRIGTAPVDGSGLDWPAGMAAGSAAEFGWALEGEAPLTAELHREALADLERLDSAEPAVPATDAPAAEGPAAPVLDRTGPAGGPAAVQPLAVRVFEDELREAHRPGVGGWVDDDLALVTAWGFDPAEIRVPVIVRWDVHDGAVPASHGAWLAGRIPTAEPHPEIAEAATPDPATRIAQLAALAARLREA